MSTLASLRRALSERRPLVLSLVGVLALNALAYAFGVYPLQQRVANVQERDRAAEQLLANSRREFEGARGTLTGKERAATELATFYQEVLPDGLAGARRLTHLRLAQLARESKLMFERSTFEPEPVRGSSLTRVKSELVLRGDYDGMRAFIYALESSSDFLVIDDVGLAEGSEADGELVLTLQLSTYFRTVTS